MARKLALRPAAPEFRMMECGKHIRPSNIPKEPREKHRRLPKPEKRYRRALRPNEKRGSCICDYHDYPHLREERENLDPEYKTLKKTFPFLKLPAEIRNKMYEELLVTEEAIEFYPDPFFLNGFQPRIRHTAPWVKEYEQVEKNQEQWMKDNMGASCSLRPERVPILECDWVVALDYFLFKIGLKKSAILHEVTVCHPDCARLPRSVAECYKFGQGSPIIGFHENFEAGFEYARRWFEDPIAMDPALVLQKAGKLEQLGLVAPAGLNITFIQSPIDAACFENLTTIVISCRSEQHRADDGPCIYLAGRQLKTADAADHMAADHVAVTGETWASADAVIDLDFHY